MVNLELRKKSELLVHRLLYNLAINIIVYTVGLWAE